jgi:hypothetical protein
MKKLIFLTAPVCLALAGGAPAGAQQRRAMTIEDLIVAPRVADPQLSPDGRTVLYVQTATDGKTGRRNADIWSVPADGTGQAKAIIAGDREGAYANVMRAIDLVQQAGVTAIALENVRPE